VVIVTSSATALEVLVSIPHMTDLSRSMSKSTVRSIRALAILSIEFAFNCFEIVAEVSSVLLVISVVLPLSTTSL
jgi:hypothetical protein